MYLNDVVRIKPIATQHFQAYAKPLRGDVAMLVGHYSEHLHADARQHHSGPCSIKLLLEIIATDQDL